LKVLAAAAEGAGMIIMIRMIAILMTAGMALMYDSDLQPAFPALVFVAFFHMVAIRHCSSSKINSPIG